MYIDRVKRLRAFIADLPPRKLIMKRWAKVDKMPDKSVPSLSIMCEPSCNTAGCLAGWTSTRFRLWDKVDADKNAAFAQGRAANYLGLSYAESSSLFCMDWPLGVCGLGWADGTDGAREKFDKLRAAKRKQVMLQVLDHIIAEGFTWVDPIYRAPRIPRYLKPKAA